MATYKRIDGDYVITTINSADNMEINTHTLQINGNLVVSGNLTYIEVNELTVDDPFITVAANNTGNIANALFPNQGLVTQTSANTFAGIRFNNALLTWEISPGVDADGDAITPYAAIGTAAAGAPGGNVGDIQFKGGANNFSGNSVFKIDPSQGSVTLLGHLVLGNLGAVPATVANTAILYANTPGAADSGVYVSSPAVQDELVSRTRAIAFGLIF